MMGVIEIFDFQIDRTAMHSSTKEIFHFQAKTKAITDYSAEQIAAVPDEWP